MAKIIGLQDVIECNYMLKEKGLFFKVHIRDACGKQSLWIEPLNNSLCEEQMDEVCSSIQIYFKNKGFTIVYSEDRLNFWVE